MEDQNLAALTALRLYCRRNAVRACPTGGGRIPGARIPIHHSKDLEGGDRLQTPPCGAAPKQVTGDDFHWAQSSNRHKLRTERLDNGTILSGRHVGWADGIHERMSG